MLLGVWLPPLGSDDPHGTTSLGAQISIAHGCHVDLFVFISYILYMFNVFACCLYDFVTKKNDHDLFVRCSFSTSGVGCVSFGLIVSLFWMDDFDFVLLFVPISLDFRQPRTAQKRRLKSLSICPCNSMSEQLNLINQSKMDTLNRQNLTNKHLKTSKNCDVFVFFLPPNISKTNQPWYLRLCSRRPRLWSRPLGRRRTGTFGAPSVPFWSRNWSHWCWKIVPFHTWKFKKASDVSDLIWSYLMLFESLGNMDQFISCPL